MLSTPQLVSSSINDNVNVNDDENEINDVNDDGNFCDNIRFIYYHLTSKRAIYCNTPLIRCYADSMSPYNASRQDNSPKGCNKDEKNERKHIKLA